MILIRGTVVAAALTMAAACATRAPREHAAHEPQLGTMRFQTSCTPAAQTEFEMGMRYQHSFWYRASKTSFEAALKADPGCAIAYWGIAQSLLANPFNPTPPKNLAEGLTAIQTALKLGAKTGRETALITAIGAFYADYSTLDQRTRAQAYAKAMEDVARRFPDDDEVQIYYALSLQMSAPPTDKTYTNQLKAAEILEPIFKRQPQHPGVAHYLIHTYDHPSLASRGLDAAVRYASIAEAAPHAQHMPSHIFTRIGRWQESIASNAEAARLARANQEPDDQLHASDYMVYAYLQLGRDREAQALVAEMQTVSGYNPDRNTAAFALAASPARYVVERGDWTAAARLTPKPSKFAYADAMTHFARALGAIRSGARETAAADIAKLGDLRDALKAAKDAYWSDQVDIQRQSASAWLLLVEGRQDAALQAMRAAADAEDKTDKATVTPGPLAPARELYGAMLLELGRAKEALAAFEETMAKEPNRYNGLAGAAKSAALLGDVDKAKTYYTKLIAQTRGASGDRPAIEEARRYLELRRE